MQPMLPMPYRVVDRWQELDDTWTLSLTPADGGTLPTFAPGQFNMLYAFGAGEVPVSISGDPADAGVLLHTIRAVGDVTAALVRLEAGAMLGVRGPFGRSWPLPVCGSRDAEAAGVQPAGQELVIVTGGIGLAPLRPAIYQALARSGRRGQIHLYYGARGPEQVLYSQQLRAWQQRSDITVDITVDHAGRDWSGRVGLVTDLLRRPAFDPANSIALVCGPEVMMRYVVRTLQNLGLPDDAIHLSLERKMQCATGSCGHCQLGPYFVCRDGPVFAWPAVAGMLSVAEL